MSPGYGALRLWATVLIFVGVLGVVFVVIGTIFAVIQAEIFAQGLAMLLISGMLVALFASWPIALGQGLRAIADVAEYVQELATLRRGRHESHEYTRPARDRPWAWYGLRVVGS